MEKDSDHIHVGSILKAAVDASGITIGKLSKKARYSRSAYYKHTKNPNLPMTVLSSYSEALDHDFSKEVPGFKQAIADDPAGYRSNSKLPQTLEEAIAELALAYKRLAAMQEKYTNLLEEMSNRKR